MRNRISGALSCPSFRRPTAGELSVAKAAVMLKQTVPRTLLNADSGAMQLESEQCIDGTWVAVSDARVLRREELITDLARDSSLLVLSLIHI